MIKRLIEAGKNISLIVKPKTINAATAKKLVGKICWVCPFYENDCDFADGKENALPCGGFTLLGSLIKANIISIDDINNTD